MRQRIWLWQTAFGVLLALGGLNFVAPQTAAACSCGLLLELLSPVDGGAMPADGFILANTSLFDLTLVDPVGNEVPTDTEDYGARHVSRNCDPYLAVLRPRQALEPGSGYRLLGGRDGAVELIEFEVVDATLPIQAVPSLGTSWAENNMPAYNDVNSCGPVYVNAQSYDLEVTVHNPASEPALLRVESYTACGEPNGHLAIMVEPGNDRLNFPYYGHAILDGIERIHPKDLASDCVRLRLTDVFGRPLASSLTCPPPGASEAERGDCPDYIAPRPPVGSPMLDGGLVEGSQAGAMIDASLWPSADAGDVPSDVDAAVPRTTVNITDVSTAPFSQSDAGGTQESGTVGPPAFEPGWSCAVPGRAPVDRDLSGALLLLGVLFGWVRLRSSRRR